MSRLKVGDRISLKLSGNLVVSPYADYTDIRTFDIVGFDCHNERFYLYVPSYILINNTIKVDNYNYKKLFLETKYIGDEVLSITEADVFQVVSSLDGMFCSECKDFYSYATVADNNSFICWSCRSIPR